MSSLQCVSVPPTVSFLHCIVQIKIMTSQKGDKSNLATLVHIFVVHSGVSATGRRGARLLITRKVCPHRSSPAVVRVQVPQAYRWKTVTIKLKRIRRIPWTDKHILLQSQECLPILRQYRKRHHKASETPRYSQVDVFCH